MVRMGVPDVALLIKHLVGKAFYSNPPDGDFVRWSDLKCRFTYESVSGMQMRMNTQRVWGITLEVLSTCGLVRSTYGLVRSAYG